jgi:hypothetical protein
MQGVEATSRKRDKVNPKEALIVTSPPKETIGVHRNSIHREKGYIEKLLVNTNSH